MPQQGAVSGFFTFRIMASRLARISRTAWILDVFAVALAGGVQSLVGQELELIRVYPGSGPYECVAPALPAPPSPDERARAGQLASDANQAMVLGEMSQVQTLLQEAVRLDPSSADLAYRHARVLEDLDRPEPAMAEYCRALDLDVEALGVVDARERLTGLSDALRNRIPGAAREAFSNGLLQADDSLFLDAEASFSAAIEIAPGWPEPVYNRAVVNERAGLTPQALRDFRNYLELVAQDENQTIRVSERIGELEGMASVATPNPAGALALGLVPGMGHFYTSRPLAGAVALSTAGLALAAGISVKQVTTVCLTDVAPGTPCPASDIVDELSRRPLLWIGVGLAAAVTAASAIDAYLGAKGRREAFTAITEPNDNVTLEAGLPRVSADGSRLSMSVVRLRFR